MEDSIFYFVRFTFFFWLYIIFIPAKVMGIKLSGKGAGENALKAIISSHVAIISCVYALALMHIYNTVTLFLSLVLVILVYWKLVKKVSYKENLLAAFRWLALISSGQYKLRIFIREGFRSGKQDLKQFIKSYGKTLFSKYIFEYFVVFLSFGILIARKWKLVFDNYAYLTSDMYVHNDWINFMEQGDIFYDGVYPFGMHNMLSAFHKMSFLNLNVVLRYWGAFNCILLAVMLWFIANRIFHSRVAAVIPVVIYCVTDFTSYSYGYRTIYTLPQETGMLFLFPCIYYFGRFLKNKKWKDGLYFAMSAAVVLANHFYSVIFAVLMCAGICVPFIKDVIKPAMIKKLLLSVGLIALISITPFMLGLASGKYWQGSMGWAMGVMSSESQEAASDEEAENEDEEEQAGEGTSEEENVSVTGGEKVSFVEKIKNKLVAMYQLQIVDMNSYWGTVFWICMGLFVIYFAGLILFKKVTWNDKMYAGIWVYLLLLVLMYSYSILGLPKIMNENRMTMFIGYAAPLLLALPAELFCRIMPKKVRLIGAIGSYGVAVLLFYVTYYLGYAPVQSHYKLEPSLAAKVCVKADDELPKGTWTIVSPVEGVSLVRNRGYHYELWEFISNMEVYTEDMYLEIPTKYVFFVLEKKPIIYNEVQYDNLEYDLEPISMFDAYSIFTSEMLGISDTGSMKFYNILENRRIMEAKLYYWLEEYKKAFPEQMEVYLEDDECIVYKFEQNPYMLNNFAIDYEFNEISQLDYYKRLCKVMKSRGEDVSEVEAKIAELQEEAEDTEKEEAQQQTENQQGEEQTEEQQAEQEENGQEENKQEKEKTEQKKEDAGQE